MVAGRFLVLFFAAVFPLAVDASTKGKWTVIVKTANSLWSGTDDKLSIILNSKNGVKTNDKPLANGDNGAFYRNRNSTFQIHVGKELGFLESITLTLTKPDGDNRENSWKDYQVNLTAPDGKKYKTDVVKEWIGGKEWSGSKIPNSKTFPVTLFSPGQAKVVQGPTSSAPTTITPTTKPTTATSSQPTKPGGGSTPTSAPKPTSGAPTTKPTTKAATSSTASKPTSGAPTTKSTTASSTVAGTPTTKSTTSAVSGGTTTASASTTKAASGSTTPAGSTTQSIATSSGGNQNKTTPPTPAPGLSPFQQYMLTAINLMRFCHGVGPLIHNRTLDQAANKIAQKSGALGKTSIDTNSPYGQIVRARNAPENAQELVFYIIGQIYKSVEAYNWPDPEWPQPKALDFVQLITTSAKQVGIAKAKSKFGAFVALDFDHQPEGNNLRQTVKPFAKDLRVGSETGVDENQGASYGQPLAKKTLKDQGQQGANNDTCPAGFSYSKHSKRCFSFQATPQTWENAIAQCARNGATLASIVSKEENDFVAGLMIGAKEAWIAFNDRHQESRYTFVNGDQVNYYNFEATEPTGPGENCVSMEKNDTENGWLDRKCQNKLPSICVTPARGQIIYKIKTRITPVGGQGQGQNQCQQQCQGQTQAQPHCEQQCQAQAQIQTQCEPQCQGQAPIQAQCHQPCQAQAQLQTQCQPQCQGQAPIQSQCQNLCHDQAVARDKTEKSNAAKIKDVLKMPFQSTFGEGGQNPITFVGEQEETGADGSYVTVFAKTNPLGDVNVGQYLANYLDSHGHHLSPDSKELAYVVSVEILNPASGVCFSSCFSTCSSQCNPSCCSASGSFTLPAAAPAPPAVVAAAYPVAYPAYTAPVSSYQAVQPQPQIVRPVHLGYQQPQAYYQPVAQPMQSYAALPQQYHQSYAAAPLVGVNPYQAPSAVGCVRACRNQHRCPTYCHSKCCKL